jgi:hypothetical protein
MQLILILLNLIPSVMMAKDGKNIISMMDFDFELTNYAFQIALFEFCYCRKLIQVVLWDTLESRKQSKCWMIISFGRKCEEMWQGMFSVAKTATKLSLV